MWEKRRARRGGAPGNWSSASFGYGECAAEKKD